MKMVKVTTDGEVSIVKVDRRDYRSMAREIGADMIQYVRVMTGTLGLDRYEMIVDEEGLLKDQPKVNPIGCVLYGTLDHGHPIMGDMLLTLMKDSYEGRDSVDMPDDEAAELVEKMLALKVVLDELGGFDMFKKRFAGATAADFPVRVIMIPDGADIMDYI